MTNVLGCRSAVHDLWVVAEKMALQWPALQLLLPSRLMLFWGSKKKLWFACAQYYP